MVIAVKYFHARGLNAHNIQVRKQIIRVTN